MSKKKLKQSIEELEKRLDSLEKKFMFLLCEASQTLELTLLGTKRIAFIPLLGVMAVIFC